MPDEIPAELKFITTYLQRSKELATREPIVAYYCQLYAVKLAIQKDLSAESRTYLLSLMDNLEKQKASLKDYEAISNPTIGFVHVENFALKVFASADNEDLNQGATKKTAMTFLAASVFLELLNVFEEELLDDTVQKIKYAKFKAADIIKAIKEGRTPRRGNGEPDVQTPAGGSTGNDPSASNQNAAGPSAPVDPLDFPSTPTAPVLPPTSPTVKRLEEIDDPLDEPEYNEKEHQDIIQAGKFAKFAQSALLYDDIETAILNLEKSLKLLKPLRKLE